MATAEEVKKLAALARIRVPEAELDKFTKEFDAILAYVGQLATLVVDKSPDAAAASREKLVNVFREDANATPAGTWTEKLAAAFPEREDDYLVVKQIIKHD
jgi:aspartyl/glutamyl-tRNA(Asn/Gln) amidotransferase C subunit